MSERNDRPRIVLVNRCVIENDEGRLLLIKRSQNDRFNPGLWEFPGGKLEAGQDLQTALRREVIEETGLTVEPVSPLVYADSFVIKEGNKYAGLPYVVIFNIGRIISGEIQLSEHDDYAWETQDGALARELTPESEKALRFLAGTLLQGQACIK